MNPVVIDFGVVPKELDVEEDIAIPLVIILPVVADCSAEVVVIEEVDVCADEVPDEDFDEEEVEDFDRFVTVILKSIIPPFIHIANAETHHRIYGCRPMLYRRKEEANNSATQYVFLKS